MRKLFLATILSACISCIAASAQVSTASVDPQEDSVAFADMRARMDRIRRTEHRPTVALVLSGGGAKGAAHVGVIRYLEEQKIPVDMVLGTSMGGLVGGLYAMGYNADQLQEILTDLDWNIVLSDKVPQDYVSYATKMYKSRYAISVPFHYTKDVFYDRAGVAVPVEESAHRLKKNKSMESELDALGARNDEGGLPMNTVWKSLPAGYIDGINVNSVLSEKTVGYQDSINFRELPIPFCCVASDMVTCCAKNWTSGSINEALRSTMSIPGLFNPVRTHGMVLVDGGTRNNFPTDIAREMGADYIIGVDLSDVNLTYQDINNIGDILWTFIDMLGREAFAKNVSIPDVFIKPVLTEFNMMSFSKENIRTITQRGYEAAQRNAESIKTLKGRMPASELKLRNTPAIDISKKDVQIRSIEYVGLTDFESSYLSKKLKFHAGDYVSSSDINDAVAMMFATGSFVSVDYKLYGDTQPFRLVFICRKGPVHKVGVGFRADSEEMVDLLFNVGFNTQKIAGSKFDFTGKLGLNKYADARYTFDTPGVPTLNIDAKISDNVGNVLSGPSKYRVSYWGHKEQVYISNVKWTKFDFKVGGRNEYFGIEDWLSNGESALTSSELADISGDFLSVFADARLYTMDNIYYPTRGADLGLNYSWVFLNPQNTSFKPLNIASVNYRQVFPMGSRFAMLTDIHARAVIGPGDTNPVFRNYIGGSMGGRYLDQRVPFIGFNDAYIAGDYMASLCADFRLNVYDNLFLSAQAGFFKSANTLKSEFTEFNIDAVGAAIEIGYNSLVGPVKFNVHWSDLTRSVGTYFTFGYDF